MATLVCPKEVRNNAVMQAQLADLYVEALQNERIQQDVIKEAPAKFSINMGKSEGQEGTSVVGS